MKPLVTRETLTYLCSCNGDYVKDKLRGAIMLPFFISRCDSWFLIIIAQIVKLEETVISLHFRYHSNLLTSKKMKLEVKSLQRYY